jgi:uncharacterized phage infection (PIP) family protein YhgE
MNSRVACLLAASLLASACVTTRAATPVERPALEVPPVPPRIIEPAPTPETTPEPVSDLPPEKPTPPAARPRPQPPRDTQKPADPKPVELPPAPVDQPPPPPPNVAPLLRTPATADPAVAERQIRDTLSKVQTGLNNVNFQRLSDGAKKAYNEVKDFMLGAEAAIKTSNFELGKELASKAEKLANELQGR